jgi:integrase
MATDDLWYLRTRGLDGARLPSKRHGRGKRWRVRYTDPAGNKAERLFDGKRDAERYDAAMRADIARGVYISPALARESVRDYGERWRAALGGREATVDALERSLRRHVYPVLGAMAIGEVRRSTIQAWVKGLDHLAPRTVANVYVHASMLFRAAALDKVIAASPCIQIALPPVISDDRVILTPDQVRTLAEEIRAPYSAAIYTGAGCGLRFGELVGLELGHVDWLNREITINQQAVGKRGVGLALGQPKTSSSYRVVELPKATAEALARHVELHPPKPIQVTDATNPRKVHTRTARILFPSPTGKLLSSTSWTYAWKPAARAAGIPPGDGFHLLRHFFATTMIFGGANVKDVQLALGHSKPSITLDTYTGLWPSDEQRTRHLLDAAMGEPFIPPAVGE